MVTKRKSADDSGTRSAVASRKRRKTHNVDIAPLDFGAPTPANRTPKSGKKTTINPAPTTSKHANTSNRLKYSTKVATNTTKTPVRSEKKQATATPAASSSSSSPSSSSSSRAARRTLASTIPNSPRAQIQQAWSLEAHAAALARVRLNDADADSVSLGNKEQQQHRADENKAVDASEGLTCIVYTLRRLWARASKQGIVAYAAFAAVIICTMLLRSHLFGTWPAWAQHEIAGGSYENGGVNVEHTVTRLIPSPEPRVSAMDEAVANMTLEARHLSQQIQTSLTNGTAVGSAQWHAASSRLESLSADAETMMKNTRALHDMLHSSREKKNGKRRTTRGPRPGDRSPQEMIKDILSRVQELVRLLGIRADVPAASESHITTTRSGRDDSDDVGELASRTSQELEALLDGQFARQWDLPLATAKQRSDGDDERDDSPDAEALRLTADTLLKRGALSIDYAAALRGGRVLSSGSVGERRQQPPLHQPLTSRPLVSGTSYAGRLRLRSQLSGLGRRPDVVISSAPVRAGDCYAIGGTQGQITLLLAQPIAVQSIDVVHAAADDAMPYIAESALGDFHVVGWVKAAAATDAGSSSEEDGTSETPHFSSSIAMGSYYFDMHADAPQLIVDDIGVSKMTVRVSPDYSSPVDAVSLAFTSNHGNADYTCVYRVRVYGEPITPH